MENNNREQHSKKHSGITVGAVVVVLGLAIIVGGIYNAVKYPCTFWQMTFGNCLTLLIALFLSFFFVQRKAEQDRVKADQRKQKEAAIRLLEALQDVVLSKAAYEVTKETGTEPLTMTKRRISNYLDTLKKNANGFGIDAEIEQLDGYLKEYSSLIGNHIHSVDELQNCSKDLLRPLELIDEKIFEMIFVLHK